MPPLPPLDVSLSSRRMACILDGELALSRQGLLFAMRLAQEANVWLFRALWNALDNSHFYPASQELEGAGRGAAGRRPSSGNRPAWPPILPGCSSFLSATHAMNRCC